MDSEGITQEQAAAALDTIEECRELIEVERAKQNRIQTRDLLIGGITPIVVYASKDLVRGRATRWAVIAGWRAAHLGLSALTRDDLRVLSGMPVVRPSSMRRPAILTFVAIAGMAGAERLAVWSLRRTRLRRPNIVAGLVVAGLRIGFRGFMLDQITRAGQRGEPVTAGQLHPALRNAETLRLAAILSAGEIVALPFLRETLGTDRLGLAAILQPLVDDQLLKSIIMRDNVRVFLTPDGREAFAQHELALRELSTGDTPR